MSRPRPSERRLRREAPDPLQGVANLFDLGLVIALGFLLALVAYLGLPEILERGEVTLVKNPGTPEMEVIHKDGVEITRYRVSREKASGEGRRLGTAYRLENGDVVYIPE